MLVCLMLSHRSLRLSSFFFFILFSIFYSIAVISTILSSRSLSHSYASIILLLIPSSVLLISVCLFLSSSRSLANILCIFSILFLRSWMKGQETPEKQLNEVEISNLSEIEFLSLHLEHNSLLFHPK